MEYVYFCMKFRGFFLFAVNGSDSVVGSIGPSVSVKGSNLDGSSVVTVVTATIPVSMTKTTVSVTATIPVSMTKTVSVTSQTSIETTVVTSIGTSVQNSGVSFGLSFGLSLPFANSVDHGSNPVVGSIGPAVGVDGSSLDGSGVAVVTSITS